MATVTPRKNKAGEIVSYQIEVYRGRDKNGKKLKPYSMNWKVPEGWRSTSIKKELTRIAGEFETNCKMGNISIEKQTFAEYADYVMQLKERDNKHRTVHRYRQLLQRICPEIGHLRLTSITAEHLNRFYMKLAEKGQNHKNGGYLSNKTILEYHRLIHCIFTQAVKEGLIKYNIADTATPPKQIKKEAEYFELDEIEKIIEALHSETLKYQAIIGLMIDTGARRGEIIGLKWANIDFKKCQIKIERSILYTAEKGTYESTTKTNEIRVINISPEIVNILKQYKKEQTEMRIKLGSYWQETGFCFTKDNGTPMNPESIKNWLDRFSKRHNLPHIHPHKFRHTQASLLYANGIDPITISKRLGHSQVSTTQNIYAHLMANSDKNASESIAESLYRKKS